MRHVGFLTRDRAGAVATYLVGRVASVPRVVFDHEIVVVNTFAQLEEAIALLLVAMQAGSLINGLAVIWVRGFQ